VSALKKTLWLGRFQSLALISFFITTNSLAAVDKCRLYLGNVHSIVTPRSFAKIEHALMNAAEKGVRGPIQRIAIEDVVQGRRTLLSLGEGASDFVRKLTEASSRRTNIHALDAIYNDVHGNINDEEMRGYDPDFNGPALKSFILDHPFNYHAGYFADFSIRDDRGHELLFDEILSSHALAYVLELDADLLPEIIEKHLAAGGYLRILGMYDSVWSKIKPVVQSLLQAGTIANCTDSRTSPGVLTMQKTWAKPKF
jgi:hypothetical protein